MQRGLIQALCEKGQVEEAVNVLFLLATPPCTYTYLCLLKACTQSKSLSLTKQVHTHLSENNVSLSGLLGDYLVISLARCGAPDDALLAIRTLPSRTVFSWTAVISAYSDLGYGIEALQVYQSMVEDGIESDRYTFVSLLKACGTISNLEQGKGLHREAEKRGFTSDVFVSSTLVSVYGKCNAIAEAEHVFSNLSNRTVVSWNAMLSAYVEQRHGDKALQLFVDMQGEVEPSHLTYVIALQACVVLAENQKVLLGNGPTSKSMALEIGQALHADARIKGLSSNIFVGSALVTLYGKCADIGKAEHTFAVLPEHSLVSSTAMLSAYMDQGQGEKALHLYRQMKQLGVAWDDVTLTCALQACGAVGSLETCQQLHFGIVSAGFDAILPVEATLIHAYGSCGSMLDGEVLFNGFAESSIVLWNASIAGHAAEGNSLACLRMFRELILTGILPDEVTYNSALTACSHSGIVTEGIEYFELIKEVRVSTPDIKHYGTMLDLLGRAGSFQMVANMLERMPIAADVSIWLCLLGACRAHGNIELAKHAYDRAVVLQPNQDTAYIVMSSFYADMVLLE